MRRLRLSTLLAVLPLGAVILGAMSLASRADPVAYVFDAKRSDVSFSYSLPLSTGRGRFTGVTGTALIDDAAPAKTKVETLIDTRTLRAGDSIAQGELRGTDFFNVAAFPQMRFKSRSVRAKNAMSGEMTGDMTVKGITHPIVLKVTLQPPGPEGTREMRATTRIRRADFNMTAYAFLVGETVDIEIRGVLRPKP